MFLRTLNRVKHLRLSGLKNEKDLINLSKLKIDFISMGDLTKNISSIDFSLNII